MSINESTDNQDSALKVNEGISQPGQINPLAMERFKLKQQPLLNTEGYFNGILEGNRVILSKAITLIESVNPAHHSLAQEVIEKCLFGKIIKNRNYGSSRCWQKHLHRSTWYAGNYSRSSVGGAGH